MAHPNTRIVELVEEDVFYEDMNVYLHNLLTPRTPQKLHYHKGIAR